VTLGYQIYRDGDCYSVDFRPDMDDARYEAFRRSCCECGVWRWRETRGNAFGRREGSFIAGVKQPHPLAHFFA